MIAYWKHWEVVGATFHAGVWCAGCAESLPEVDPEGNPKHALVLGDVDDEMIERWVCDGCGSSCADW